jgi:hypothetical protein
MWSDRSKNKKTGEGLEKPSDKISKSNESVNQRLGNPCVIWRGDKRRDKNGREMKSWERDGLEDFGRDWSGLGSFGGNWESGMTCRSLHKKFTIQRLI